MSEADAKRIEEAIEETKKAVEEGGTERINRAVEELTQASHKLAEVMYQSTQSGAAGAQAESPPPGGEAETGTNAGQEEEVIDAEYVDVEDKK